MAGQEKREKNYQTVISHEAIRKAINEWWALETKWNYWYEYIHLAIISKNVKQNATKLVHWLCSVV